MVKRKSQLVISRSRVRQTYHFITNNRRAALLIVFICVCVLYYQRQSILNAAEKLWYLSLSHTKGYNDLSLESFNGPKRELRLVQVLFRHGHRSPFKIYPTDPNPRSLWIEGTGQLSKLGRVQHYALGEYLRKRYQGFITRNPREVHCLSSGAERCLYGAYSLLAGMYPPPRDKLIHENLHWQPIPVEYNIESKDRYLQSTPNCPTSDMEKKRMPKTPEGMAFIEKYKSYYEFWANKSGLRVTNYDQAGSLFKTLFVQKTLNLIIPDWAQETWNELSIQGDMCYYFHFKSKVIQRLRAGPILGRILDNMRTKVQYPNDIMKVYLYSGHGSNIASVLQALRHFNFKIPPYTSCIIFELYQQNQEYSVRLLFSNSTVPEQSIPEPHVLKLEGCGEYCPLQYVEKFTKDMIPLDWRKECLAGKLQQTSTTKWPDGTENKPIN